VTSDDPGKGRSLDEVYALIDKSRGEAAKIAQAKFHYDMEAAIATIASIGSIASARVLADSRVASANALIEAELAAARLLAEAELQVSRCAKEVLTQSREIVEASLQEIGRYTATQLTVVAQEAVEKIERDAEAAIKVLRDTGAVAIREVQTLAARVAEQTKQDAELAAAKLAEFRKHSHTIDEAISDGEDLAKAVIRVAESVSVHLQRVVDATLSKINVITDNACTAIQEATVAAKKKIEMGLERGAYRLTETLNAYLERI
jgi:hypothetical protein